MSVLPRQATSVSRWGRNSMPPNRERFRKWCNQEIKLVEPCCCSVFLVCFRLAARPIHHAELLLGAFRNADQPSRVVARPGRERFVRMSVHLPDRRPHEVQQQIFFPRPPGHPSTHAPAMILAWTIRGGHSWGPMVGCRCSTSTPVAGKVAQSG